MTITCGNRPAHNGTTGTHATVAGVRVCFSTVATWACDWQVERLVQTGEEEYEQRVVDCGAIAWTTSTGHTCENGHNHVSARHRADQGWDYAGDMREAANLAKLGVAPVSMDGRSMIPDMSLAH